MKKVKLTKEEEWQLFINMIYDAFGEDFYYQSYNDEDWDDDVLNEFVNKMIDKLKNLVLTTKEK